MRPSTTEAAQGILRSYREHEPSAQRAPALTCPLEKRRECGVSAECECRERAHNEVSDCTGCAWQHNRRCQAAGRFYFIPFFMTFCVGRTPLTLHRVGLRAPRTPHPYSRPVLHPRLNPRQSVRGQTSGG
eukprot:scaffold91735_cov60-Phaeocystis_antarctica.AAC.2